MSPPNKRPVGRPRKTIPADPNWTLTRYRSSQSKSKKSDKERKAVKVQESHAAEKVRNLRLNHTVKRKIMKYKLLTEGSRTSKSAVRSKPLPKINETEWRSNLLQQLQKVSPGVKKEDLDRWITRHSWIARKNGIPESKFDKKMQQNVKLKIEMGDESSESEEEESITTIIQPDQTVLEEKGSDNSSNSGSEIEENNPYPRLSVELSRVNVGGKSERTEEPEAAGATESNQTNESEQSCDEDGLPKIDEMDLVPLRNMLESSAELRLVDDEVPSTSSDLRSYFPNSVDQLIGDSTSNELPPMPTGSIVEEIDVSDGDDSPFLKPEILATVHKKSTHQLKEPRSSVVTLGEISRAIQMLRPIRSVVTGQAVSYLEPLYNHLSLRQRRLCMGHNEEQEGPVRNVKIEPIDIIDLEE